jgi:hypothetical protein
MFISRAMLHVPLHPLIPVFLNAAEGLALLPALLLSQPATNHLALSMNSIERVSNQLSLAIDELTKL